MLAVDRDKELADLRFEVAFLREAYIHATVVIQTLMDERDYLYQDLGELEARLGGIVSEAV